MSMRAVVYDRYGSPDVLRIEEIPVPSPAAGQVLVKVAATSVNLSDWETLVGRPLYARIGGLRTPARKTLGSDIAGWVEAVGANVTRFRAGDEVYGDNLALKGGFAEFAIAPESALARKPPELTFAEASTIPQSGAISFAGTAGTRTDHRVLINGAGGGTGAFAIQLAKRLGAHVTGVDNAGKLDFMRAVGADDVIDYRSQDFTRSGPYDLILDLVAHRSVFAYRRALAPGGRYRCVGGSVATLLRVLTAGTVVGALTGRRLGRARRQGRPVPLRTSGRTLRGRRSAHPHRPPVPARGSTRSAGVCRCGTCSRQGRRHLRVVSRFTTSFDAGGDPLGVA